MSCPYRLGSSLSQCGEVVAFPHLPGGVYLLPAKSKGRYCIHDLREWYAAAILGSTFIFLSFKVDFELD